MAVTRCERRNLRRKNSRDGGVVFLAFDRENATYVADFGRFGRNVGD